MARRKKIVITTETARIVRISGQARGERAWCPACEVSVITLRPAIAARLAAISERAIYARVESGRLHAIERPDGLILICLNSLLGEEHAARTVAAFSRIEGSEWAYAI